MLRGANAAFLPLAITFGVLALVLLIRGNATWLAFLPMAITFGVLALKGGRDDGDADDESP